MNNDAPEPKPDSSGSVPPPRPPRRTAIGLGPEDDDSEKNNPKNLDDLDSLFLEGNDDSGKITPEKTIVRISLPPKPAKPENEASRLENLASQYGLRFLRTISPPDAKTLACVDVKTARQYVIFPLSLVNDEGLLKIAISDPGDLDSIDALSHLIKVPCDLVVVPREEILRAISSYYKGAQ